MPVPDSGVFAALGFAEESGIPYGMGLVRNHYVGRTFIEPKQSIRHFGVKVKLNPVRSVVAGKRVVLVDDSIVRGTTSKKIVKMLKAAGASEVHMRISSPPTMNPCHYGIDTPRRKELIAATHDLDETREFIEADSLGYLSLEGMLTAFGRGENEACAACFSGRYPIPLTRARPAGDALSHRRAARGRLGGEAGRDLPAARPSGQALTAAAEVAADALEFSPEDGGKSVRLRLRVSAGASRRRVLGVHGGALKLSVKAPPEKGRANKDVVSLVAETFGLAPSDVEILSGETSPDKVVRLALSPQEAAAGCRIGPRPTGVLERELHEARSLDRVIVVRRDVDEAERRRRGLAPRASWAAYRVGPPGSRRPAASASTASARRRPRRVPRNAGRTQSLFISQIPSSSFRSATHPAGSSSAKARSSRPSGAAYAPGSPATSASKFWKQSEIPSAFWYSTKSVRAVSTSAGEAASRMSMARGRFDISGHSRISPPHRPRLTLLRSAP